MDDRIEAWDDIQKQGGLSRSHLTSLMYDTNALPECGPKMPEQEMYGVAVSLTTARPLLDRIAELERENEALRKDAQWRPRFDAMEPEQERLAIQFCEEIAGRRGEKGRAPDPVRLLEMAEAMIEEYMNTRSLHAPDGHTIRARE